jgi:hypothetical protein
MSMSLPLSDPQRPLQLAIRSARLLGIVSAAFGLVLTIVFGYFNRMQLYRPHFIALGLIVWFIPGVLFITSAAMMRQARRRGAVGAIFIAAVQEIFALAFLVGSCLLPPVSPIPILLSALWAAALVQLIVHLFQSLPLLQADTHRRHGFEVAGATPVMVLKTDERQEAKTPR